MRLRIDLELSDRQIAALAQLALVMGWRRSDFAAGHVRAPNAAWTEREQRDACKFAITHLVPSESPIPLDTQSQRSASSEPSAEQSKRQSGAPVRSARSERS